mmetsp:Transcript_7502/g.11217  ORF Transcript_7502/g.11217 Transcript_7502/m.11217 type:complete len:376 (+) Transcript_7502:331-1458(+)
MDFVFPLLVACALILLPTTHSVSPATKTKLPTPLSLGLNELAAVLSDSDKPKIVRAKNLWKALSNGIDVWNGGDEVSLSPPTLRETRKHFGPLPWDIPTISQSTCGTLKFLICLEDKAEVEAVLIPSDKRTTLCLSSQVGCNRACSFCATGRMGFTRNLSSEEILAQVYYARRYAKEYQMPPLQNIVFMGMGEPLDNVNEVKVALRQITDPFMFNFGSGHVSLSTVGPSPQQINMMIDLPCRLAWSVHAADDELRKFLVPTTRHSMEELRDAFSNVLKKRNNEHLFVEVTMIEDVNDSILDAENLCNLLRPLPGKTRINLIPYNDIRHPTFRQSSDESIEKFKNFLIQKGFVVTVRRTRGEKESSACGQLAVIAH